MFRLPFMVNNVHKLDDRHTCSVEDGIVTIRRNGLIFVSGTGYVARHSYPGGREKLTEVVVGRIGLRAPDDVLSAIDKELKA